MAEIADSTAVRDLLSEETPEPKDDLFGDEAIDTSETDEKDRRKKAKQEAKELKKERPKRKKSSRVQACCR